VTVADESEKTFSAKQVARKIGTDARQLRKFFRDPVSGYDAVGQGARYEFTEKEIAEISAKFWDWSSTKTRRNRVSTKAAVGGVTNAAVPAPRRERLIDRPAPKLQLSPRDVERLTREGRDMLRAVGLDENTPPDFELDGYTLPDSEDDLVELD
jgi:hypothetical protein